MKEPVKISNHNKRFSVTIQVPEDVAARWPEWFTTEKLMGEVFKAAAVAAVPARTRLVSRLGVIAAIVLVVELFVGGLVLGYIGSGRLRLVVADAVAEPAVPSAEPVTAADVSAPATATPTATVDQAVAAASETPAPAAAEPATAEPAATSVPSTITALKPARTYRVQVGAFRQRINANQLMYRLRADGYRPVLRTFRGLLLVQVGAFEDRAGAQTLAAELRARRYDALVIP